MSGAPHPHVGRDDVPPGVDPDWTLFGIGVEAIVDRFTEPAGATAPADDAETGDVAEPADNDKTGADDAETDVAEPADVAESGSERAGATGSGERATAPVRAR